ncbi:MAG: glycosyltransferase [Ignavibacteriae bacterium]|nr:glycosyltransferase [Ignavibacteriota bacterium]
MNLLKNADVPVGGAAVEWYTWIRAFRKLGCKFGLLTWEGAKNAVNERYDFDFVESYDLNKGIPKLRLLTYRIPSFYKTIKNYNPDFIMQGCATINTGILAFIAKLLGKPFIHRIGSDMDVDGRIDRTFSKWYLSVYYYGIKNATHISCQNKYQYNILTKKYPQKSISILHNPYFIKEQTFKNDNVKEYIAWVGNFRFEKNLPALAKIAKELPQYKFKIAGTKFAKTDDDSANGLEKLEQLSNIEFVGHITNDSIPEFLSKAYCLLNTSRLEGFSNTFLEAWAVGTPVMSTKNVNPDNIISDFNIGIVAENYEEMPKRLDDLIKRKDYKKYEERCINYVKDKHDPVKLAEKFLQDMINCTK